MYLLSAREQVINKSNKLGYCVKKESKFSESESRQSQSQDINGKETSSKVPTSTPRIFHAKKRGHDVFR